jgi:hypothetical protein
MQKNCVHKYVNAKTIPTETVPGMGGRVKESSKESEFNCHIFDTL